MVIPVGDYRKALNPAEIASKRKPAAAAGPGSAPEGLWPGGSSGIISNGVKLKYLLIALIIIGLGIGTSLTLFQSEEKRVKKHFRLLSEGVSKEPGENIFTMDQKIKKIGSLFDETCEMNVPAHSLSGMLTRDEITGYAARGRLHFSQLHLKFYDFKITLPQEGIANVHLTARVTGKTRAGEAVNEAHELDCLLKKAEKKWLFSHIKVVEVLKK
ncbi:MAG: hypothetical protein A2V86_08775 [Deltaproteobacteria bacterium RBG_16_49_23]|nr:MAG: hypothetical protein A2V86_08775 [Deltaproteobacteria bacterium RBG_16_49_23]